MKGPIPVLHLITTIEPGGAERQLLALLGAMDRTKFRPSVAYLKGDGALASEFEHASVPVVRFTASNVFSQTRQLVILLRDRYPILHTHLIRADLVGAVAARLARTPILISSRHNDDAFLNNPVVALLHRTSSRPASRVIAISDWVRRFVINRRAIDHPEKVTRVHYGFDLGEDQSPTTARVELGIADDRFVAGVIARLVEQKGHRYLLDAWSTVARQIPGAVLLIVGHGPLRSELEEQAHRLELSSSVEFMGFRSNAPSMIAAFDVLVLPSLWEGFGLVLLEAMAAERPIVASNVSAIPEVVEHGVTGILVPPRDATALADALVELARDPVKARALGRAGRARLERHFEINRSARVIEQIYLDEFSRAGGTMRSATTFTVRS